jgi:hypothetical protein
VSRGGDQADRREDVEAATPSAQAAGARAASKPRAKAKTQTGLSGSDLKRAYEVFQGNFFEGSWMGNRELEDAFLAWAERTAPKGRDTDYRVAVAVGNEEARGIPCPLRSSRVRPHWRS